MPPARALLCTLLCATLLALSPVAHGSWWDDLLDVFSGEDGDAPATVQDAAQAAATALGQDDIAAALRDALEQGTRRVVDQVSATDGFNGDPRIRIPLPEQLEPVRNVLSRIGMQGIVDDLEVRLNRAAEEAAPEAQALFMEAITTMRIEDARAILDGPPDAATQYFRGRMADGLAAAMVPKVDAALAEVGAIRTYEQVVGEYADLPFMPQVRADLTGHVVDRAVAGIFLYLGEQEAAIRADPQRWTTDMLERVFGR